MKRNSVIVIALGAALAFAACGKEETKKAEPAPKPNEPETKAPEKPEPISQKELKLRLGELVKAVNARDTAKMAEFFADDIVLEYVDSVPPIKSTGKDAVVKGAEGYFKAFPDAKTEASYVFMNGKDEVVVVSSMYGTNTGEFMGQPATNKTVGMMSARHLKVNPQGQVVYEAAYMDQGTMMGQLGLMGEEGMARVREPVEVQGNPPKFISTTDSDTELRNLDTVDHMGKAMNAHNVEVTMQHYADDATFSYMSDREDRKGKEAMSKAMTDWFKMTSDVKSTMKWTWAAGDFVVGVSETTGTNDGPLPFGNMPATNKKFKTTELHVMELADAKIKHHWIFANSVAMASQLGLMPKPGEKPAGAEGDEDDGEAPAEE